ncbi:hypothetical protein VNO77_42116 [Canavalia gladiata]|uniref:Uncharacterized protein n=1 Tax=Canavalia gladiata TaxID=3824 RepID=A0AAN9PT39_CANGL
MGFEPVSLGMWTWGHTDSGRYVQPCELFNVMTYSTNSIYVYWARLLIVYQEGFTGGPHGHLIGLSFCMETFPCEDAQRAWVSLFFWVRLEMVTLLAPLTCQGNYMHEYSAFVASIMVYSVICFKRNKGNHLSTANELVSYNSDHVELRRGHKLTATLRGFTSLHPSIGHHRIRMLQMALACALSRIEKEPFLRLEVDLVATTNGQDRRALTLLEVAMISDIKLVHCLWKFSNLPIGRGTNHRSLRRRIRIEKPQKSVSSSACNGGVRVYFVPWGRLEPPSPPSFPFFFTFS